MKFESFTEAYAALIAKVYNESEYTSAPRGIPIKESLGVRFEITDPCNRIPQVKGRDWSVTYCIAELIWYLSGNDSSSWISNYSSFWSNISDDGVTANSAYGARIFKPHPRIASTIDKDWTQWDYVLNELASDPDSRRAVIHIRTPHDSVLAKKDVPCTLSLQFFIRESKLHLIVTMRSTDLIFGLGYDVPAFTLMQELMALQLSEKLRTPIGLGSYIHVSNSLHIYEKHFRMAEEIISGRVGHIHRMPQMPSTNPPVSLMMHSESLIRECDAAYKLPDIVEHLSSMFHPYYADWIKVLGAHRAKKLGNMNMSRMILDWTDDECYRFDGVVT